jgi:hypothetical protein
MSDVYIDADVTIAIIAALQSLGHSVRHARRDPQMAEAPDGKQLWLAANRGDVLVTHNRTDFRLLHDAWRRWSTGWGVKAPRGGILIVPQRTPIEILAGAIHEQLAVMIENELFEWVRGRGWRHHPYRP